MALQRTGSRSRRFERNLTRSVPGSAEPTMPRLEIYLLFVCVCLIRAGTAVSVLGVAAER